METITGSVERITYYNPQNGYTVLRLRVDAGKSGWFKPASLITVVGNLPELKAGKV